MLERTNQILQWAGTAAFMTMYGLMNFFPNLHPYNIVAGATGGLLYLVWSIRVRNQAQMLTNVAGLLMCLGGLFKAIG